jgi:hypothetical protein
MRRLRLIALFIGTAGMGLSAQNGISGIEADLSGSGLIPISWARDSPTLPHLGYDVIVGLEYDTPFSLPLRIEAGYLNVRASDISPSGELYRAWEGMRFALLSGYIFELGTIGQLGLLQLSALGGAAITAADYTGTALAYAYPSAILEPRLCLILTAARGSSTATGPWLALPFELMFRAGTYSFSPGLSLGWSYRLGGWE